MKKRRPIRRSKRGRHKESFREAAQRLGPLFGPLLWLRWNHPDEEMRETLADVGRAIVGVTFE